jgi:DNA polymerase I
MKRLVYDIEANGLVNLELDKKGSIRQIADTIHCICVEDADTGDRWSYKPDQIEHAIELLKTADVIIGHNIIDYDNRVLEKLYGWTPTCKLIDTLIVGRLMHPDRTNMPNGLESHSLSSWAQYVGDYKMDYDGGWQVFTEDMLKYCVQDVAANVSILNAQQAWVNDNWKLINFEQRVAQICATMAMTGFGFNLSAAEQLEYELTARRAELEDELRKAFPQIRARRFSDKTGKELKATVEDFNPGSSKQWAERLSAKYDWKPEITSSGNAVVDEETLSSLTYPEAKLGLEYRDINKKIGMIIDWIKRTIDGRICGRTNSQGTATGRASHSQPNLAQVPSDARCRALFGPTRPGWVQIGCDLSGIELRCLAHYMAPYDDGAYANEIMTGDIHTKNQKAAGLPTRANAKTFIYALIYGAGDAKIGSIVGGKAKQGKTLKTSFFTAIPALKQLIEAAQFKAKKTGRLKLLDGREVLIRSDYKALNTLLQGAGAVISKAWIILAKEYLTDIPHDLMAWVHDELQVSCPPDRAEEVGNLLIKAANDAGTRLGFNMPVDAEYSIGKDWSECH